MPHRAIGWVPWGLSIRSVPSGLCHRVCGTRCVAQVWAGCSERRTACACWLFRLMPSDDTGVESDTAGAGRNPWTIALAILAGAFVVDGEIVTARGMSASSTGMRTPCAVRTPASTGSGGRDRRWVGDGARRPGRLLLARARCTRPRAAPTLTSDTPEVLAAVAGGPGATYSIPSSPRWAGESRSRISSGTVSSDRELTDQSGGAKR